MSIYILGSGGFAREIEYLAEKSYTYQIDGLIDKENVWRR